MGTSAASFLESHADKLTEDGHRRLVRHGHLPEREIATGIGHVGVRQPRVRDRASRGEERIRFSPSILPPYARRSTFLGDFRPDFWVSDRYGGQFGWAEKENQVCLSHFS